MGLGGWIRDRASDVADTVGDVVDAGTDVVEDVVDGATDFAGTVFDTGRNIVSGATDWIGDRISDIAGGIGDALGWLKDRALGWLNSLFNPFRWVFRAIEWVFKGLDDWFGRWWDAIKQLARGINAPATLQSTAEAWDSGPVAQLAGLEQTISAQSLLADEGWTGTAGQAYVATIPGQVAAVTAVRTLASNTSQALKDASGSLKTLYAEAGGIVGRVYSAINGSPGSLFNLETVLELVNLDFDRVLDIMKAIKEFAEQMQAQKEKLAAMATENSAFPGGAWPKATTA